MGLEAGRLGYFHSERTAPSLTVGLLPHLLTRMNSSEALFAAVPPDVRKGFALPCGLRLILGLRPHGA